MGGLAEHYLQQCPDDARELAIHLFAGVSADQQHLKPCSLNTHKAHQPHHITIQFTPVVAITQIARFPMHFRTSWCLCMVVVVVVVSMVVVVVMMVIIGSMIGHRQLRPPASSTYIYIIQ